MSPAERVLTAIGWLQFETRGTRIGEIVDLLVDALADDMTVVELRQEIEFLRAELHAVAGVS